MFDPSSGPRVFALPPGVDFLRGFLAGLEHRLYDHPPETWPKVQIYLNTRRAERRLRALFQAGPARLLPDIRLITDLAVDPTILGDGVVPVPALRRRLDLSRAITALLDTAPDIAPRSAIFDLAESLAALLDEMHGEGVSPDDLRALDVAHHSAHWARSLTFLSILNEFYLDETAPDSESRQRQAVEVLRTRWQQSPPDNPVLVVGSTGSRGTTAMFMQAVADLPNGALVLPGYDFDLPEASWHVLQSRPEAGDHPQAVIGKLLSKLNLKPGDVARWTGADPAEPSRNRLISLALRPAPVTDQWLVEGPELQGLAAATDAMTLIEAPDQRAEATAIAFALRQAAESGRRATLITPDRQLTRQVTAALDRWSLVPDDSAGRPLALTPPGVFLRMVVGLFGEDLTGEALLALLKHPLTHSGDGGRGDHLLRSRELELEMLRGGSPFPDLAEIRHWAGARNKDPGAVPWAVWLADLLDGLGDIRNRTLAEFVALHLSVANRLASGPDGRESSLWQKDAGQKAAETCAELRAHADAGGIFSPSEYAALFRAVLDRAEVREALTPHPDITIWGTLEARVEGADLVILGGLNDGIWPGLPGADPWLNRGMRAAAGLLLPERRIGLSAHDFQQAIAAPEVILSRSRRSAEAPTVASRWLIRLTNLLDGLAAEGKTALKGMRERGNALLDLADALDRPATPVPAAPRPSPRPPVASRPDGLSVTQIDRLIRDPYSIYARDILRLRPLEPLRPVPDARMRGEVLHNALEAFIAATMETLPPNAEARLMEVAARELALSAPWPAARRLWLAMLGRVAAEFVKGEQARRTRGQPLLLETKTRISLLDPPFVLTAKADRIDRTFEGDYVVYDYKTGALPTKAQIERFNKQLPLEGRMIELGAFPGLPPGSVAALEHIRLASSYEVRAIDLSGGIIADTWTGLARLIEAYRLRTTGYTARARMEKAKDHSDYDHLSRRGEWDDSDRARPEDVG